MTGNVINYEGMHNQSTGLNLKSKCVYNLATSLVVHIINHAINYIFCPQFKL